MCKNSKIKIAMLLSNWYSGATLLTILLDNHSQITSNGETFPFNYSDTARYQCSCGNFIDECKFYQYSCSHMKNSEGDDWNKSLFSIAPHFSNIKSIDKYLNSVRYEGAFRSFVIISNYFWKRSFDNFRQAQYIFFKKAIKYNNSSIYMDGTKSIRRAQIFSNDKNIDLKIINLVRDGRAYCHSFIKHGNLSSDSYAKAATNWNGYIQMTEKLKIDFPGTKYLDIRYEDICSNTEKSLDRIYKFLGLSYEKFNNRTEMDNHILGHNMRKSFSGKIIERTEWRSEISKEKQKEITLIMKPYLKKFDYI